MKRVFSLPINDNRVYGLDILRALAILFVLIQHGKFLAPRYLYSKIEWFYLDGVSIFFVLSGFLIGSILLKTFVSSTPSKSILFNFWIRRWFRTLPNYFLILTVLLLLSVFIKGDYFVNDKLPYYIFSQNLFYPHPNFFSEAWSLSVEEWFYLLIPIFLFSIIRFFKWNINRAFLFTAIGIIIGVTLFRYLKFVNIENISGRDWELVFRKQVFTRLDSLMFGLMGAYFSLNYREKWIKYKSVCFVIGVIFLISMKIDELFIGKFTWFNCIFFFTIESVGVLLLLPLLSTLKAGEGFVFRILTFISLISYSLYLTHLSLVQVYLIRPISNFLFEFKMNWYLFLSIRYLAYLFISIILSFLLYKYFEVPMMNLRDRIKIK